MGKKPLISVGENFDILSRKHTFIPVGKKTTVKSVGGKTLKKTLIPVGKNFDNHEK